MPSSLPRTLDIRSGAPDPAGRLSNFAANPFALDDVRCAGMEGFLQSLKFADAAEQERICALDGAAANAAGQRREWRHSQTLYWRGRPLSRGGATYQELLDRAFAALAAASEPFRAALLATGDAALTHDIGKTDPRDTVLTRAEMLSRLEDLRRRLSER